MTITAENLAAFNNAVVAFGGKLTEDQCALFQRRITLEALTRIVKRTPVDTGRARGNWQTSVGIAADGVIDGVEKNVASVVAKGSASLRSLRPFGFTHIANNLPYAEALENGHSKQAPNGMVGVTFAELEAGLSGAVLEIASSEQGDGHGGGDQP